MHVRRYMFAVETITMLPVLNIKKVAPVAAGKNSHHFHSRLFVRNTFKTIVGFAQNITAIK
jgi:hypothetical protein